MIQEYLDKGWAPLYENEGGAFLIGPVNVGCIDNGAQIGTFNRVNGSAQFHLVNLENPRIKRLALEFATAVVAESMQRKAEGKKA